jgi:tetratricopeptide (TPR) repeat protein
VLTDEMAGNPDSLAFVELGMLLRRAGDFTGAERVMSVGVARHPGHVQARSLYGEVLLDRGKLKDAFREWSEVVETDTRDLWARKGLGYLFYKGGKLEDALEQLEIALSIDPLDQQVRQAYSRIREELDQADIAGAAGAQEAVKDMMLSDSHGRPLTGSLKALGRDVSEEVAAYLVGVSDEAERTARMLGLGEWSWILCESGRGALHVSQPTEDSTLVLIDPPGMRTAELALRAESAGKMAKQWMDETRVD